MMLAMRFSFSRDAIMREVCNASLPIASQIDRSCWGTWMSCSIAGTVGAMPVQAEPRGSNCSFSVAKRSIGRSFVSAWMRGLAMLRSQAPTCALAVAASRISP